MLKGVFLFPVWIFTFFLEKKTMQSELKSRILSRTRKTVTEYYVKYPLVQNMFTNWYGTNCKHLITASGIDDEFHLSMLIETSWK